MLGQKSAAVLLREEPVEAPRIVRKGANVEDIDNQKIAGLGTLDADGAAEEMHDAQVDVPHVGRQLVVLDEAAGPVVALDDEIAARLHRRDHRNVRMPPIVDHIVFISRLGQIDLDECVRHGIPFLCFGDVGGSNSQITRDLFLIEVGAEIFMHDVAALQDQHPVGDIERETEHLFRRDDAEAALVTDAF